MLTAMINTLELYFQLSLHPLSFCHRIFLAAQILQVSLLSFDWSHRGLHVLKLLMLEKAGIHLPNKVISISLYDSRLKYLPAILLL